MGKPSSGKKPSSSGERKFEKKIQFYTKVGQAIDALNAQKAITKRKKVRSRQKKLKAYDLSALSALLPALETSRRKGPVAEFKLNCKSRQKLILKEAKKLSTVLSDPTFQSDPLSDIQKRLEKTQPVEDEKPKKKVKKNGSQKSRGKNSKSLVGHAYMET